MKPIDLIPLVSGRLDFVEKWANGCRRMQNEQDAWIAKLRGEGVKAAHPDDGWVDRDRNTITFCYPQFNDGAGVGDRVALGWYDQHRIVTLLRLRDKFCAVDDTWYFKQ